MYEEMGGEGASASETHVVGQADGADGLQHAQNAHRVRVSSVLWHLERHSHMRLRGEVVNLTWPD